MSNYDDLTGEKKREVAEYIHKCGEYARGVWLNVKEFPPTETTIKSNPWIVLRVLDEEDSDMETKFHLIMCRPCEKDNFMTLISSWGEYLVLPQ